jgi:MYXO-CTERM domain-containing protein
LQSAHDRLITRFTRVRLALGILVLASGLTRMASAQTGSAGATGTTSLAASDLLIAVQQSPGVALPDFDLQRFFNVANCNCNLPVYVFFTFSQSGFAKKATLPEGTIEFWTGLNCNSVTVRNCTKLGDTLSLATFGANGGVVITSDVRTLSQNFGQPAITGTTTIGDGGVVIGDGGATGAGACDSGIAFSQTIWALVTFTGDPPYDVSATLAVNVDMAPPPPPDVNSHLDSNGRIPPGSEALIVSWTGLNTSTYPDLLGYQVLCDRGGSLQVFKNGTFGAGFRTCAKTPLPGAPIDNNILGLDPNFVCSPLLTPTASSYRLKILQNDITYGVSVVAIDTHYNASQPIVNFGIPVKTLSFYDVYRNGDESNTNPGAQPEPGRASGGYCAVSPTTSRSAGAAGLAAVALAVGLAFARRRRRPRS